MARRRILKNSGGGITHNAMTEAEIIEGRTVYEASGEAEKLVNIVHYPELEIIKVFTLGKDRKRYTHFIKLSSLCGIDVGTP